MNNTSVQLQELEANLKRLQGRLPDLPVSSVHLSRLILHLGRVMTGMLEQQIRPFGLAEVEFRVLTTLFSQPDGCAYPTELCARTSQSPANMSRISDALVSRDLITRVSSMHDRRKMVLRITEQGEDLVRRLLPTLYGPLREMFKDFSEDAQQQLIVQLKHLGSMLDQMMSQHYSERAE
ncbi:MAG: MarR family transcriptional regulator, negative regulator of the multidrug operon emrRAB [Gammaproteobacteria bacterium]|jgi:MarR family transcriptional repressor of emrRAB|nr:MarR family transcriptional regulator, negative regulator of the multidrug operon emrRAB [Gammaproteobacteria bacterium]